MKQRKNIQKLTPYTSARDLYTSGLFLDANENYKQWIKIDWKKIDALNRYPESTSETLRKKLVEKYLKTVDWTEVFIGSGSDEIIDLLIRGFVEDSEAVMLMHPSYSVYEVQSEINNKKVKKVLLNSDFTLNISEIKKNITNVKMLFLCSPNNPTGNLVSEDEIDQIMKFYKGLLVIDEAYIEFAGLKNSQANLRKKYPNIIILRTFSKAWGLAGIRCGYAIADKSLIDVLLKIKDSYNISKPTQLIALQALDQIDGLKKALKDIAAEKKRLTNEIKKLGMIVTQTYANFILVQIPEAKQTYKSLATAGVIVRDRSNLPYMDNMLRVTIGSKKENTKLIGELKKLIKKS